MQNFYTRAEQLEILQYIIRNKCYKYVKGQVIWKEMERLKVCKRSWQSMRSRFVTYIMRNLRTFNLPEKEIICILKGYDPNYIDRPPEVPCSTDSDDVSTPDKLPKVDLSNERIRGKRDCDTDSAHFPSPTKLPKLDLCTQLVQTTDITTEDKCTMTDQQDLNDNEQDAKSGWHMISANGTIHIGWHKFDQFFIPDSVGNDMVRHISDKHQIPLDHIHTVDETRVTNMLKFLSLKTQCEHLLRLTAESNLQIAQKGVNHNNKSNNPIVTSEIVSDCVHPTLNIRNNEVTNNNSTTENLSLLVDNEINSATNSENTFLTAETNENDTLHYFTCDITSPNKNI